MQNHLLIIHNHSVEYPNSGSVRKALDKYFRRLRNIKRISSVMPLIAIVVDIAYRNPSTYPISAAILSKLLDFIDTVDDKKRVIKRIQNKFSQIPNTGYMDLWLQRISYPHKTDIKFAEPLCKLVQKDPAVVLWNRDWITDQALLAAISNTDVVDFEKLNNMPAVVSREEVALFNSGDYPY